MISSFFITYIVGISFISNCKRNRSNEKQYNFKAEKEEQRNIFLKQNKTKQKRNSLSPRLCMHI